MKENVFQKALIEKLYSQGAWTFNVHGHKMQKSGVADVLVVHRRWAGFIELKTEDNKTSAKQKSVALNLIKRFFPTYVVRCRGTNLLTIENFHGEVLCRPAGLDKVLDCLQALSQNTRDWVKMPKLAAEAFRTCRAGDVVYYAGNRFLCEGKMK